MTAAIGAWAVAPDETADEACSVVPAWADCGDSAKVPERAAGAWPESTPVDPILAAPTFASGLELLEAPGPPRLPPEFLTPAPRCGPSLAAGRDFLFFFL
ncbi:hypothetical protein ATO49_14370 [Mycolicibacterium fortuitum subsp. fortuitum DSM 46621 = ATCC 6841 = JCM 6387]|nr:hypothetical protein ATO49_14370 [Mycolicibacterium fortuitum subsp. fortuitum DSM 46621 = ATCC 6841 = JCM 6387]